MGKIKLKGLKFYSYHGVLSQEHTTGGEYIVNIEIEYPLEKAMISDNISDTLDYSKVYSIIKDEMKIPSDLLENVANRTCKSLFLYDNNISKICIEITKCLPPISEIECDGISISIEVRK